MFRAACGLQARAISAMVYHGRRLVLTVAAFRGDGEALVYALLRQQSLPGMTQ